MKNPISDFEQEPAQEDTNLIADFTLPRILLIAENIRVIEPILSALKDDGLPVMLAHGYPAGIEHWSEHRQPIVLIDVPRLEEVEPAIDTAVAIKRRDPAQFIGYLADNTLHTSGLTGDALFPRSSTRLPTLLRTHLVAPGGNPPSFWG
ncbi:hypothetical protein [Silvibacterium sp.]|uniref:hypothetical protein n=1 Tax=Silvibacterium sp. TaxID=1964179 RepID=UPI0039E59A8C